MGEKSDLLEVLPLSTVSKKELERAKFVGANMDEVVDPEERAENTDMSQLVRARVNKLTDRQKAVINKRFPPDGSKRKTLDEIGEEFGVSREAIRQTEARAFRKLRYASNLTPLVKDHFGTPTQKGRKLEDEIQVNFNSVVNTCHRGDLPKALNSLAEARVKLLVTLPRDIQLDGNNIRHIGSVISRDSLYLIVVNPNYIFLTDEALEDNLSKYTYYPKQVREVLRQAENEDVPVKKDLKRFESMVKTRFKAELEKVNLPPVPKRDVRPGGGGISQQPQLKIPPHLK